MEIIYLLSVIVFIVIFIMDEVKCSGQMSLSSLVAIITVGLIPVVNMLVIIWYMCDQHDIVLYRKK